MADALARLFPLDKIFENNGFITKDYINDISHKLHGDAFIWGHPKSGVADMLMDKADIITILRRPEEQCVSNYLQIRSHPDEVNYRDTWDLSLSDYLRRHPYQIPLQACVLYEALYHEPMSSLDELDRRLPEILAFLKAIKFVGVLDSVDEACPVLADLVMPDWNLTMPLMNSAVIRGFEPEQIRALRREYRAMKNSGEFSRLFEIEETVYRTARDLFDKALARCKAARRDVDRRARLAPRHVHIDAVRFSNHNGRVERGRHVCPLADLNRHIIFGPYDRLDPGTYEVEFLFTTSNIPRGGSGVITLDATANRDNVLALRRFDAAALNGAGRRSLKIKNKNGSASFEYRLHAVGFESGAVEFHGVIVRRLSALNSLRSDLVGMFEKIRAWDRRLGSSGGRIAGPVAAHRMLGEREPA